MTSTARGTMAALATGSLVGAIVGVAWAPSLAQVLIPAAGSAAVAPGTVPATIVAGISVEQIAAFASAVIAILSAGVVGWIKIKNVLDRTKNIVVTGQLAANARGVVAERAQKEIHLLVNSRLLTVLRLLSIITKEKADRTGDAQDIMAYSVAKMELEKAEAGAMAVAQTNAMEADQERIAVAHTEVAASVARTGVKMPPTTPSAPAMPTIELPAPAAEEGGQDAQRALVSALQRLVEVTRLEAEKTGSSIDIAALDAAKSDLSRAEAGLVRTKVVEAPVIVIAPRPPVAPPGSITP